MKDKGGNLKSEARLAAWDDKKSQMRPGEEESVLN